MGKGMKKILAVVLVVIIVSAAAYYLLKAKGYETGTATLSDVLNSKSVRKVANTPTIVSHESPYYALIGTPVALYYDGAKQKASPLLVVNPADPSRGVIRFMNQYNNPPVVTIGDVPNPLSSYEREWEKDNPTSVTLDVTKSFDGSAKSMSLSVAKYFWKSSDGVVLIKNNQIGYNQAVVAVTLASYVNIPVIVTNSVDEDVAKTLDGLGVKYSIVCGDMKGYKLTKHFSSVEEIQDWTASVVRIRLGSDVNYITMTNPLDIYKKNVLEDKYLDLGLFNGANYDSVDNPYEGTITDSEATSYPGAPPTELTGPVFKFDVPYKYTNLIIDLKMEISGEERGDDSGARCYVFLGKDLNNNNQIDEEQESQYFCGSPGYEITGLSGPSWTDRPPGKAESIVNCNDGNPKSSYAYFHTQIPLFNDQGDHIIQLLGKIPTTNYPMPATERTASYTLSIKAENMESYIFPRMHNASSLASYLTAYHKGVVFAKPDYMLYNDEYAKQKDFSNPAQNNDIIESTNERAMFVKNELNNLLARLAGNMPTGTDNDIVALANYYYPLDGEGNQIKNFTYLGILADPQMIPQYFYPSTGQGDLVEGLCIPGDNIYSDIDADPENPPLGLNDDTRLELADGRILGFDTQDISALLGRTFFYSDIIENIQGVFNGQDSRIDEKWMNTGLSLIGTEPPVGSAETAAYKVYTMWTDPDVGFKAINPVELWNPVTAAYPARQNAAGYYMSANFIYFCAHGFFYWYVPTAVQSVTHPWADTSGGGAFDVAHVKLMNLGPSVLWADSCVTGRIDGIEMSNALTNAFLHAGLNCFVGATREMWGGLVPIPDAASGEKLGSLMMLYFYGHLTGKVYDKSTESYVHATPENVTAGAALMLAKNEFMINQGEDGGGVNDDTYEEMIVHGDPAFNPYEPNHEGG